MKTIASQFLNKVGEDQAIDLLYRQTPSYYREKSNELRYLGVPRSIEITVDVGADTVIVEFTDQSQLVFIGDNVEAY